LRRSSTAPSHTAASGAGLVLLGAFFVQWSASIAVPAIGAVGGLATSGWRFLFGAIVLMALVRPKLGRWTREQWQGATILGVATGFMNIAFFQAIGRIHLGTAVAIEFMGPFLVAVIAKRSWRHLAFGLIAVAGVVALARPGGGLTWVGAVYAAGAGAGWAAYTFASHHVGRAIDGFGGLAVAMSVSSLMTVCFIFPSLSAVSNSPSLLGRFLVMSIMATVIGFSCELQALRRLPPSDVAVLLSLNPAVAFLVGWVFLGQAVRPLDIVGMVLVVLAGAAVTRDAAGRASTLAL